MDVSSSPSRPPVSPLAAVIERVSARPALIGAIVTLLSLGGVVQAGMRISETASAFQPTAADSGQLPPGAGPTVWLAFWLAVGVVGLLATAFGWASLPLMPRRASRRDDAGTTGAAWWPRRGRSGPDRHAAPHLRAAGGDTIDAAQIRESASAAPAAGETSAASPPAATTNTPRGAAISPRTAPGPDRHHDARPRRGVGAAPGGARTATEASATEASATESESAVEVAATTVIGHRTSRGVAAVHLAFDTAIALVIGTAASAALVLLVITVGLIVSQVM